MIIEQQNGFRGLRGLRDFGDRDEYGSGRDREHYIDNEGFHGFVGRGDLVDDFLLIPAFLC